MVTNHLLSPSRAQRLTFAALMAEHIERVGRRIRERRDELGMTQGELARKLSGNPDAAQVSRWERGIHEPSASRKEEIAAALDTTVADLMAGPIADRPEKPTETPDPLAVYNRNNQDSARLKRLEDLALKNAETLEAGQQALATALRILGDEVLPALARLQPTPKPRTAAKSRPKGRQARAS